MTQRDAKSNARRYQAKRLEHFRSKPHIDQNSCMLGTKLDFAKAAGELGRPIECSSTV
jgi:hypothetical protein